MDDGEREIRSRLAAPEQRSLNEIIFLPAAASAAGLLDTVTRPIGVWPPQCNTLNRRVQTLRTTKQVKFRHLRCAAMIFLVPVMADEGKFRP